MSELDLHKFITDNNIEWHRRDVNGSEDIIIFPNFSEMDDFKKILSSCLFDDGGIECRLMDGYFAFCMNDICEYYGVEMNKVFIGNDW